MTGGSPLALVVAAGEATPLLQGQGLASTLWGLGLAVLVWAGVLTLVFWHGGRMWAVARQTILQAIRMRLAVVLILFLILLTALLPTLLRSDDTPSGKIRIFITYGVYGAEFLLCVLTLFLSTATLCSEIKEKQIYCLDTKPVPRWCVLAGKWCGIMIIDMVLLAAVGGMLYAGVRVQARLSRFARQKVTPETPGYVRNEIERLRTGNQVLHSQLLRARASRQPDLPDVKKLVDMQFEEMKRRNVVPGERSEQWTRMMLSNVIANEVWAVPPAMVRVWQVKGLAKDLPPQEWVTVRFYSRGIERPIKNEVTGLWTAGRFDLKEGKFKSPHVASFRLTRKCDAYQDFLVRASLIDPETGTLTVTFYNPPELRQPTVLFPLGADEEGKGIVGLSVLYPVGGIGVNLVRGLALAFTRLAFLAVLGLTCATFLSFPVASFTAFTIFVMALSMGFLVSIIGNVYVFGTDMVRPGTPLPETDVFVRGMIRTALFLLPDFRPYDPVPYLSDGLAVPWGLVARATLVLIALRGTILAAFGGLVFYRRELAALDR